MQCRFVDSIESIGAECWNALVDNTDPFMHYDFLYALEVSGCVNAASGWQPHHLVVQHNEMIIAVMPLYAKYHSYGEYIFDFAWARAYQQYGLEYYPKLLSAIPFVPATGLRLAHASAVNAEQLFKCVAESLRSLAQAEHFSSIHILLSAAAESVHWNSSGLQQKIGTQFHWHNHNYTSFEQFLESFNARKRKAVKKERAAIAHAGIAIEMRLGVDMSAELWDKYFAFYCDTYQKRSGHNGYLKREFFSGLSASTLAQTLVIFAKRGSEYIAGALYFFSDSTLYGRHWGCSEEVDMLHFELCYYAGIEFCIARGLQKFEAGAQGEHKIQRGFVPSQIYSNHWVCDARFQPAINQNIAEESRANLQYIEEMKNFLPFKRDA